MSGEDTRGASAPMRDPLPDPIRDATTHRIRPTTASLPSTSPGATP